MTRRQLWGLLRLFAGELFALALLLVLWAAFMIFLDQAIGR